MRNNLAFLAFAILAASCNNGETEADAYGQFEADETLISAQASGELLSFSAEEGSQLKKGEQVGLIDTIQLSLKRQQLKASMEALKARMPNVASQIKVYDEQLEAAQRELKRAEKLLADKAATPKQVDDLRSQVQVLKSRKNATLTGLNDQSRSLVSETSSLEFQLKQVKDQLTKCRITNPLIGRVLNNYVEEGELVQPGKPLYRIADLDKLTLRAYVSEDQLVNLKLGQNLRVRVDQPEDEFLHYDGKLTWISEEAEFTPKVIQTKEDRVNLVYAIKVEVENDGRLKIGMPGEVLFAAADDQD